MVNLEQLMQERQEAVLESWLDMVLDTYAPEAAELMRSQPDPFANPLGSQLRRGLGRIIDGFLKDEDSVEAVGPALMDLMRLRATQGVAPSQAVGFLFLLKAAGRIALDEAELSRENEEQWWSFDARVDQMSLMGMDMYMECREQIFELRANDVKARTERLLQHAGLMVGAGVAAGSEGSSCCPTGAPGIMEFGGSSCASGSCDSCGVTDCGEDPYETGGW